MSVTGRDLMRAASIRLEEAGIDGADSEAMALIAHALGDRVPRYRLLAELARPLTPEEQARFEAALAQRVARRPMAQIRGWRHFWKHRFRVTPDVLDPRPETETLVAEALTGPFSTLLDLGTGSGCILVSLLAERPQAQGTGVDLSPLALSVARENAAIAGVEGRVTFLVSDWFASVTGHFDLIVSNPPYITAAEMAELQPEVRDWEPHLALTPGGDGLDAYRAIAAGAGGHLVSKGRILLEIGFAQGQAVAALLTAAGFAGVQILPDRDGRDRVVAGFWPG